MMRWIPRWILLGLFVLFVGCNVMSPAERGRDASSIAEDTSNRPGMGMGRGSGMMARHHATVPEDYANLTNPVPADDESLARGEEQYVALCATCHGDGGLGDGPGGVNLDPPPTNIAHTSQMLGDGYLYWRISEGGAQFESAMPAWGDNLDEETRWDLINYIRALGSGQITPRRNMGGNAFDPDVQAAHQAEMLAEAVAQGVVTQEEADVFATAHEIVDTRLGELRGTGMGADMDDRLATVLEELVVAGELTQEQADTFLSVHDRLGEAGLMQ